MKASLAAVLVCGLVAGCASQASMEREQRGERTVELRNGSARAGMARYDMDTAQCSGGLAPLVTREQFEALRSGWTKPSGAVACSGPTKRKTPLAAGYPESSAKLRRKGSAHVLVRIEADGGVESVQAVCASDGAFARAAEATARAIEYAPRMCDGVATRSAFLLPFDYDWR